MGKKLIIKGADFSENGISPSYIPICVRLGQVGIDLTRTNDSEYWTLTDSANELSGKTITGFVVQFTNTLQNNATKSCKFVFGTEEVIVTCDFVEGDTIKTKKVMLQNPFTFENSGSIMYLVIGNVSDDKRGGCDVYRKTRAVSDVSECAFSAKFFDTPPITGTDFMPFKELFLLT